MTPSDLAHRAEYTELELLHKESEAARRDVQARYAFGLLDQVGGKGDRWGDGGGCRVLAAQSLLVSCSCSLFWLLTG